MFRQQKYYNSNLEETKTALVKITLRKLRKIITIKVLDTVT